MATENGVRVADMLQVLFLLGVAQEVAIGAGSVQSVAVGANTRAVRLVATSAARVAIGPNPVAVATSTYLAAGCPEYFMVSGADKIAVIQEAAVGKLSITEVN